MSKNNTLLKFGFLFGLINAEKKSETCSGCFPLLLSPSGSLYERLTPKETRVHWLRVVCELVETLNVWVSTNTPIIQCLTTTRWIGGRGYVRCIRRRKWKDTTIVFVYYEWMKRELKIGPIYEWRYDERLNTKVEESTRLSHTGLFGELEHLKIKIRLIATVFFKFWGIFLFFIPLVTILLCLLQLLVYL